MNDLTSNPWVSPMQQSCPNCQPPVSTRAFASDTVSGNNPFLWWQQGTDSNADMAARTAGAAGVPNQQMISAGVNPNQLGRSTALTSPALTSQQPLPGGLPPTESTSNIADLGLSAPSAASAQAGGQENPITLAQLTASGEPELPGLTAISLGNQPTAINLESLQYLNGFLLTQLGRSCTVTFLIGTSTMDVRSGTLVGVGANYILLNEFETNDIVACDFYSIKFIKFYY